MIFPFVFMFLSVYRWYRKLEETIPQDSAFLCMPCSLPAMCDAQRLSWSGDTRPAMKFPLAGTNKVQHQLGKKKGEIGQGPYFAPLSCTLPVKIAIKSLKLFPYENLLIKSRGKENLQKNVCFFSGELNKRQTATKAFCN